MAQDSSKAAKARAVVASLLALESAIIAGLGIWLIVLTATADTFEFKPLLGDLLFAVLGSGGLAASA
ncbi:MAG: hypothetical protein F2949_02525, partial [Actinobacteria bacterium]|nr:hypothetical protein [Actinomycetota bacterium]